MILDEKLAAGDVVVLDGATGTEIARLGGEMNAAWCTVIGRIRSLSPLRGTNDGEPSTDL